MKWGVLGKKPKHLETNTKELSPGYEQRKSCGRYWMRLDKGHLLLKGFVLFLRHLLCARFHICLVLKSGCLRRI